MIRKNLYVVLGTVALTTTIMFLGCSKPQTAPGVSSAATTGHGHEHGASSAAQPSHPEQHDGGHSHGLGKHGGTIVSLGRDSYHVEAIVTSTGELRMYTLGSDESRIVDIEIQKLTAFVKSPDETEAISVDVQSSPQPGDREGRSSLFVAQLPSSHLGKAVQVTVPNIVIEGERFRLGFTSAPRASSTSVVPTKSVGEAERKLYLEPGGIYTQSDIEANGNLTASQKFAGFQAAHNLSPNSGDKICPITLTKSNPKCSWIVGGKAYEFCCPPCVDEFLAMAKSRPDEVKRPDDYIKN